MFPRIKHAQDAENIKLVRNALLKLYHPDVVQGRGGGTAELTQANKLAQVVLSADWQGLNRMAALVDEQREASRPVPAKRAAPSKAKPSVSTDAYKTLEKALVVVYGPRWRRMDGDTRQDLVAEAVLAWIELRLGRDPLPEEALDLVRAIRRERRDTEQEQAFTAGDEASASRAAAEEAAEAEDTGAGLDASARVMAEFRKTPEGELLANIVTLHSGSVLVAGQPEAITKEGRKHLMEYHSGAQSKEACPTCRRIARFIRLPGVTTEYVAQCVGVYLLRLRQEVISYA